MSGNADGGDRHERFAAGIEGNVRVGGSASGARGIGQNLPRQRIQPENVGTENIIVISLMSTQRDTSPEAMVDTMILGNP